MAGSIEALRIYSVAGIALLLSGAAPPTAAAPQRQSIAQLDWTPFKDQRLGYLFTFPGKVFQSTAGDPTEPLKAKTEKRSGQVFRSKDGKAFLQTAAFANVDRFDLASYQARVAATYQDGKIEYRKLGPNWFVLSGVRGNETFYERVHFTCGGRVISAWSMTYPKAEGALYDRIVEAFTRSYRPAETPQTCS